MNIEFTVEDYFKELQSMEKYYGLEEDLYPWIYILLQMVELKKKGYNKKLYIRDVHNFRAPKATEKENVKLKEFLQNSTPDFVIISELHNSLCGCVEIKKTNEFLDLQEGIFEIDTIKYKFEFSNINKSVKKDNSEEVSPYSLTQMDYKILEDEITKNIVPHELSFFHIHKYDSVSNRVSTSDKTNRKNFYLDILPAAINNRSEIILDLIYTSQKSFQVNFINETNEKITTTITVTRNATNSCINNWVLSKDYVSQLIRHLIIFQKVLYTNGLKFYYLVLIENKIHIKKIADLTKCPSACTEWNNLIDGLANIKWHQDPIVTIN